MSAPASTLAEYDDAELAQWYGATDNDAWQAILESEMERRDAEQEARSKRHAARCARRDDPVTTDWRDAAYADYLAAERACCGNLAVRDAPFADAFALWSGTEAFAMKYSTEELRAWWLEHPRVTVTSYRAHVRQQKETYRNDQLDRDDAAYVVRQLPGRHTVTAYDQIEALPTEWLWQHRIPRGEVTLVAGEGGCGKGQLAVDLAARVSTGTGMPLGGQETEPAAVIMVTPEDDLSETVAWRLRAAGADLSLVHDLTLTEHGAPFALSADQKHDGSIAQLREAVDQAGARLVIIDPLMACIAFGSIATNLGARRVIAPLQRLAKETGAAVLMTHHTVKSGQIAGSKGLLDAARVVYRVSKDKENPAIRVMSLEKSNVLGATDDVRYLLTGEGHDTRVTWLSRDELAARRKSWREGGTQEAQSELATRAARIRLGMTGRTQ